MEKADKWEKKENKILIYYKNSFEAALVEKEKSRVLGLIKELDNSIKSIIIKRSNDVEENIENIEQDEHIEKILSMFRGSIV